MLELIDQESDTLTYQGRSNLGNGQLVEWWHPDLLTLPIDIPDLDPGLRNLYILQPARIDTFSKVWKLWVISVFISPL